MGTNVVRLARADHRRIAGLVERLGGPHGAGDSLRRRLAAEIAGHANASNRALLPFAKSRVSDLGDTAPADLLDRARSVMSRDELHAALRDGTC